MAEDEITRIFVGPGRDPVIGKDSSGKWIGVEAIPGAVEKPPDHAFMHKGVRLNLGDGKEVLVSFDPDLARVVTDPDETS